MAHVTNSAHHTSRHILLYDRDTYTRSSSTAAAASTAETLGFAALVPFLSRLQQQLDSNYQKCFEAGVLCYSGVSTTIFYYRGLLVISNTLVGQTTSCCCHSVPQHAIGFAALLQAASVWSKCRPCRPCFSRPWNAQPVENSQQRTWTFKN